MPQHVLRFWEGRFAQVKPVKRAGGRRYYRPEDVDLLRGIRTLLYGDGFTIKGVQKILRDKGQRYVAELGRTQDALVPPPVMRVIEAAPRSNVIALERPVEPLPAVRDDGTRGRARAGCRTRARRGAGRGGTGQTRNPPGRIAAAQGAPAARDAGLNGRICL